MTINASGSSAWVCCQLGAREHYAIPRALYRSRTLDQLITDAWVRPRFATANPSFGGSGVAERFHSELRDARVTAFNWSLVAFEMLARVRGLRGWPLIMARNRWFERKAVSALRDNETTRRQDNKTVVGGQSSSGPLTLFAYSYAAREIFRLAKQRGWKTVLGQIDPGPVEEKIVVEEAARVSELAGYWQPVPPEYWDNWQEECSLADHIIVNSEWSRSALIKGGVSGEKLSVIPLAYEPITDTPITRAYPAHFTRDRPLRVLFLGQANLRKGVARLFEAIRHLKDEPIEFQFVGPMQVAVPEDLKNNAGVRWFGTVPRSKTAGFYRTADVLIFPTLSDGFGLTQLEAQGHALPVIASRCCGDVVKHGMNGLLLDEPTVDAIVEALRFCLADPARLAAFSAVSRVEDRFSIDALGQNLLSLADA
jgi:glycosyltransferase involved in cell wall biosynthesis